MKILVTGAAGFIGSNLVETLLKENNEVIGIDKAIERKFLLADVISEDKKMEMNKVYTSDDFTMIWDDINNIEEYYDLLSDVDKVFHLAASADIRKSYDNPTMDLKNNVLGTNEVMEYMRKKDIEYIVFSSSSSIYGVTRVVPTPEDVPDIRPISMYGASKLSNEAFIHSYSHLYGIKAWMFRFANVVGRHQHRGVIYDFVQKLNKNSEKMEILGNGEQEKSFFDVSDCISGLIDIPKKDGNKSAEIYNLGNKETMKVKELADVVCDEIGVTPDYTYTGGDRGWKGDTPYTILSIDKALSKGWSPQYNCEQAIRRTVRYLINK